MSDRSQLRRRLRLGAVLAVAVAVLAIAGVLAVGGLPAAPEAQAQAQAQQKDGETPPAMAVGVDRVRATRADETMPVIGRFVPLKAGLVAARIVGPIGAFEVEVGDVVEAGQRLAKIVPDTFERRVALRQAEVAHAQAQLETARATAKLRQQEVGRLTDLKRSPAFSQARLDDASQELAIAKSRVAEARGTLDSAKAELGIAELDLAYTDVTAPYAGVVTQRHTEEGAYVAAGAPVVSLLDDHRLEIEADVPSMRARTLQPGTEATFDLGRQTGVAARVRAVIPDENPQTRTRRVRFVVAAEAVRERVAANQSVTLSIPAAVQVAVLTVHKDAVLNRGGQRQVFVVVDGKAELRTVRLGAPVGSRFEVLDGLAAGDTVVVRGNERLRPGQPVTVAAPAAGAS